jgi:serine-type D-Ala-D-Ala carboxypeptidase (penicillin-binding protein 5/6)
MCGEKESPSSSSPHMWKFKIPKQLGDDRKLFAGLLLFLAFLYPGHNRLQTIVINPGPVKSYDVSHSKFIIYPVGDGIKAPPLSAQGIVIQDLTSHAVIFERQADRHMLPASTTKIMTALVAIDQWQNLSTVLTVKNEDRAIGQTIDLIQGEQLTVESLLKGILIHSGNDAALALADNYPGGYSAFVSAMNAKAKSLHLENTTYKNPSGIEQYGHVTTPRDLAILAGVAMSNPLIAEIVNTKFTVIKDITGEIAHPLETTNELLGAVDGLRGLKTGWTENAGECLVSYVERDGHPVVIVILGSLDRFGETSKLVDWVYGHHTWQVPEV